ncbi:TetR family transcriptional regulator [Lentzea sp. NPDC059081]|uniref:TetR family transcriptional regulator n=1 Tax=Lentzea sp. NPDC059081 TaxID=3346719 RepID=UPI00368BBA1C
MGNREDLLRAARVCLQERGLDTTARDIASLAGVSLAAIGYHFRTKDELLAHAAAEAIGDALGSWIDQTLRSTPPDTSPGETFADFCGRLPDGFAAVRTHLLTSFEHLTRLVRAGDPAATMTPALRQTVEALTGILGDIHPHLPRPELDGLAHLYNTVINGMSIIWLASPGSVPAHATFQNAITALTRDRTDTPPVQSGM